MYVVIVYTYRKTGGCQGRLVRVGRRGHMMMRRRVYEVYAVWRYRRGEGMYVG